MPRFATSSGRQTLVALRQKKKSLADSVNEQLTASALGRNGGDGSGDAEYAEGGVAEEYDFDNDNNSNQSSTHDDYGETNSSSTATLAKTMKKSGGGARTSSAGPSSSPRRLRHRGPLDASLSEGKYAATPVNVEAAMDDIFGALDMGDMDAEGEELLHGDDDSEATSEDAERAAERKGYGGDSDDTDFDSDRAAAGGKKTKKGKEKRSEAEAATRKRRRAKNLTEDEYTAWLERKSQKEKQSGRLRRPLSFGADGVNDAAMNSEEADILRQLQELRQRQHVSLVPSAESGEAAESAVVAAASTAAQSDAKATRDTVQRFIMVYGQLLRLRVLLQPAVTRAMSLPQYYARALFTQRDAAVEAAAVAEAANVEDGRRLVEKLAEQREAAVEKYAELQEDLEAVLATLYAAATGTKSRGGDDDDRDSEATASSKTRRARDGTAVPSYHDVQKYHGRVLRHADSCLEYWGSKLVQANGAKLKTISQPLPQQIAAILTARSRLRAKVQKNRSHLPILAHPEHVRATTSAEAKAQRALHIAEGDVDAEIYDDADFVRELVRRGGAVANQLEQKVKEMQRALLPSREGARKGFHRMTKGKTVNYEPRPKLVGFMMAESLDDTQRNDVVVNSIFQ